MPSSISILLPTRGRPELVGRLLQSVVEMTADPSRIEIILYADEDDPASHDIQCEEISVTRIIGPSLSMGGLNTACYRRSTGDIIVPLNDDMVIRTSGWDRRVDEVHAKFHDRIYLAYPNDLHSGQTFPSTPILSRTTCEALVHPFPEVYKGGFIDYHVMDIFKRLQALGQDRIHYLEGVVIEHLHYRYGKAEIDATYEKRGPLDVGDEVYIALRKSRQTSARRLAFCIIGSPLPELPEQPAVQPLPDSDALAVLKFIRIFLLDFALPLHWRAHLFEVLTRRYFLKKYKYPEPTWQYKILKAISPLLKIPFRLIQYLSK